MRQSGWSRLQEAHRGRSSARAPPHHPGLPMTPASRTSPTAAAIPSRLPIAPAPMRNHSLSTRQGFFASGVHNHNPVWSPDGLWLYFAHGPEPTEEMNVWRVRPSGGTPEQLTALRAAANLLAPINQRTLLYMARAEDRSGPWLWSLDVETKVTRRVTSGLEHYSSVSASRDGRRVVTTVSNPTARLWRVPLLDRQAEDRDVQPYPLPSARALSPRFAGNGVVLLVRSGRGRWPVAVPGWKSVRSLEVRQRFVVGAPGRVARWHSRGHHRQADRGNCGCRSCRRTARMHEPWRHPSPSRARAVMAARTGRRTARGSSQRAPTFRAPGLFKIPVDGGAPVRLRVWSGGQPGLVAGWSPDCVWRARRGRPGAASRGESGWAGVALPDVRTGLGGGHRFLPNGTGLVLRASQSVEGFLAARSRHEQDSPAHPPQRDGGVSARSTSRPMARKSSSIVAR